MSGKRVIRLIREVQRNISIVVQELGFFNLISQQDVEKGPDCTSRIWPVISHPPLIIMPATDVQLRNNQVIDNKFFSVLISYQQLRRIYEPVFGGKL